MKLNCLHPIPIFPSDDVHHLHGMFVPCGKCYACRRKQSLDWCTRCVFEARGVGFDNCSFLTLTYDDLSLPSCGVLKRHLQLFFKRLRKRGLRFRYYACGEYGKRTHRPHYHAILFGVNTDILRTVVDSCWSYGGVFVGYASESSVAYTTGYCNKSYSWPLGQNPIFRLVSRRPGLGLDYFWEHRDTLIVREMNYPRYFQTKEYEIFPELKDSRKVASERYYRDHFKEMSLKGSVSGKNGYRYERELNFQRYLDFRALDGLKGSL